MAKARAVSMLELVVKIFVVLSILIFWGDKTLYASRLSIEIGRPGSVIFNIAVPDFYDMQRKGSSYEFGANIRKMMIDALEIYGIFNIMDKKVYLDSPEVLWSSQYLNYRNWSMIGADLLLKVGYTLQNDKIDIVFSLIDVTKGDVLISKSGSGSSSDVKYLINIIVDEIFKALTGEPGILNTKLAFVSNQKGSKEIFLSDITGSEMRAITNYGTITMLPRVSPDGRAILFISYKDQNGPQLFYKDLNTGSIRCLSAGVEAANSAAWMPDGKRVVAGLTIKGNQDLFILDLEGNVIKKLTDYPGIETGPSVSPDGSKVAFVSDRDSSPQVYVMDISRGSSRKVSQEGKYNSSPAWSSKNQIAYASLLEGHFDIVVTDPEGQSRIRVTGGGGNHEDPTWAPNGRYLIYTSNREGKYRLYLQSLSSKMSRSLPLGEGEQRMPFWFR